MSQPLQIIQLCVFQQTMSAGLPRMYIKHHLLCVSPLRVEAVAWSVDTAVLSAAAERASALFSDTGTQPADGGAAAIELLLLAIAVISNPPQGHQEVQYWATEKGKYYKQRKVASVRKKIHLVTMHFAGTFSLFLSVSLYFSVPATHSF